MAWAIVDCGFALLILITCHVDKSCLARFLSQSRQQTSSLLFSTTTTTRVALSRCLLEDQLERLQPSQLQNLPPPQNQNQKHVAQAEVEPRNGLLPRTPTILQPPRRPLNDPGRAPRSLKVNPKPMAPPLSQNPLKSR